MNATDVVSWREALIRLSDQHFFDLMRMYLGSIRTPFNKQRLIEDLSAFLRKKENRKSILVCLDELDLEVLSAIHELPSPTQQKIVSLFSGSRTFPEIYECILNLEERLVIYRKDDAANREYALNPLLVDDIAPLLGVRNFAAPRAREEPVSVPLRIDDLTLAALYGFFLHEGCPVKNDGSFRKKTLSSLEEFFPQLYAQSDCLRLVLLAFQNLGLLVRLDEALVPEPSRWEGFAQLTSLERIAYLVAAAGGRFQRDSLRQRAQGFLEFFAALEPGGRYTREALFRIAFLLSEKAGTDSASRPHGRFATMLRDRDASASEPGQVSGSDCAGIAIAFGLIVETGNLWARNSSLETGPAGSARNPYLLVSPTFSVTLMPGFTLKDLLPLVSCMEVRDIQIAGQFEITRKSCAAAFDQGATDETLAALFAAKSSQPVPQNVMFSIREWYRTYSSVSLYHGYVIKVDESRRALFENNEHLAALIRKILAPGVYLLDVNTMEEIGEAFERAGIDSLPAVSTPSPRREPLSLPSLRVPPADVGGSFPDLSPEVVSSDDLTRHQERLYATLDALSLAPELHDSLKSRIDRRIVLVPSQLDPESVRLEKVEARGMDFLGKVRIAEYALVSGSLLEIALDEKDGSTRLLGHPVSTEKRTGDVLLKIALEPDGQIEQVSLGRAVLVRRIRGSIFSELPQSRG